MSEKQVKNQQTEVKEQKQERALETIVTPGQLVLKRFLRNKLAIFGLVLLLIMFCFAYLGPFFSPYGEYQPFHRVETIPAIYVSSADGLVQQLKTGDGHVDWSYDFKEGISGELAFDVESGHVFVPMADGSIAELDPSFKIQAEEAAEAEATAEGAEMEPTAAEGAEVEEAAAEASIQVADKVSEVREVGRYTGKSMEELIQKPYTPEIKQADGYEVRVQGDEVIRTTLKNGKEKSLFKDHKILPESFCQTPSGEVVALGYGIENKEPYVNFYQTESRGNFWSILLEKQREPYRVQVLASAKRTLDANSNPKAGHIMGTTVLGHDMFTRLMYGGRISLMVGFFVVLFEMVLGTIMGGISGYYGGAVDMVIMRIVDIFFCIPSMPLIMTLTFTLAKLKILPIKYNIYVLMIIIGVLGWAGVARFVRGQILSLREQEYMLAAEATGLKPSRRILKHLIPNVMPQLIVMATMGIGGTILYESALSFLGFGVSFPYASWGNMVNVVNDPIIMRNYLWQWIPPGVCILLTVMAFNFVGDGLRDAYDPRMKR